MGPANNNHTQNAMEANPYSTPAANVYGTSSSGEIVSPGTIAQLAGTKPWVRFIAVIMILGTLFVILAAVGMLVGGSANLAPMGGNSAYSAGMLTGMAVYYTVIAFLMIYPTMKMWKFANAISRLAASHSVVDLDAALTEQRRYWKFTGILMLIGICFAVIGVVAGIAFGMQMAKGAGLGM